MREIWRELKIERAGTERERRNDRGDREGGGGGGGASRNVPKPVDSIRLAVLTVSPNRQYLGIVRPTTPAATGPGKKRDPQVIDI